MRAFKVFCLCLASLQCYGQGEYVTLNDGAKLYMEESGRGQTLVFITGWTMTHRFFEHQKSQFSEGYHVLTYDPRGQGRSDKTTYKNTYKDHADDLRQLLQQKELSDVVLIGWSSGCLTVYEYARNFGLDGIDKVVLIDEPPKWVGDVDTEWVYGSFDDYRSSLKGLLDGPSEPGGIINWMLSNEVDSGTMQWMREEIRMTPPHVSLSLYIDGLVSDYQVDLIKMAADIPTMVMVRWNLLEEVKHWLELYAPSVQLKRISSHAMFWQRPTEFNEMLSAFLEDPGELQPGPAVPRTGNMLLPRYGPTAVTDGESIYVFGGAPNGGRNSEDFMHHGLHAAIEKINPLTLQSEFYGSGLYRRANHATVMRNGHMVTCGGRSQIGLSRPRISSCETLDVETGIYRELPALPEALRTLGMVSVDGDLFVIGGLTQDATYSRRTYRLKEGAGEWERLTDAPHPVTGQAISLGKEIYVIGGYNGEAMRSVMVFDAERLAWSTKDDLPYPLSAYSAVSYDGSIFLFGDYTQMDAVHQYDPATGTLHLLAEKITPRRHTAATVVEDQVFVIGGNQTSAGNALTTIESFDLRKLGKTAVE